MSESRGWARAHWHFWFLSLLIFILVLGLNLVDIGKHLEWNFGNVFLNKAIVATDNDARLRQSTRAIGIYQAFSSEKTQDRLEELYRLQWQSASNLMQEETSLAAYLQGQSASGKLDTKACDGSLPLIEAEWFDGVEQGSFSQQRWVGDKLSVVLFSSQPISHLACIPEPGLYRIEMTALEGEPRPIEFNVDWDNWSAGTIAYTKGDETWSARSIIVASTAGSHHLSINLANDFSDTARGIDRNGYIDYVNVIPIQP